MERYFVIYNPDGDTTVHMYTKEQLLLELNQEGLSDVEFMDKIDDADTNYWGGQMLIIKGRIEVPYPEQIITKFKIN